MGLWLRFWFFYIRVFYLHGYLCTSTCSALKGQKRSLHSLGLELGAIVSCPVGGALGSLELCLVVDLSGPEHVSFILSELENTVLCLVGPKGILIFIFHVLFLLIIIAFRKYFSPSLICVNCSTV